MSLVGTTSRFIFTTSLGLLAGYSFYRYSSSNKTSTSGKMIVDHSFQTVFAVPLSCNGCVKAVSDSLYKLGGVNKVEGNLEDQLISVEGFAAPSAIVEAIQATGKDAILRGSGASDSTYLKLDRLCFALCNGIPLRVAMQASSEPLVSAVVAHSQTDFGPKLGAAVSILETFADRTQREDDDGNREVRGLARMVQVSSGRTLVDLTVRGVAPGRYRATIREYGDIKDGAKSTGPVWHGDSSTPKGILGNVEVGQDGRGAAFVDHAFQIWEIIGHAMVLTSQNEAAGSLENDDDTVVGVIARSAGVWDNDKTVCSCTGKTLWEERKDEVRKGML